VGDKDRDSRDEKPKTDEDAAKKIEKGLADASKAVGRVGRQKVERSYFIF